MEPLILVIEPRREVAHALEEVLASAHYRTVVVPYLDRLNDLGERPDAIVVRIAFEERVPAHAALATLPAQHPPVVAIAWDETEMAEAARLKCDVVLRAPRDVSRLCEVLCEALRPCDRVGRDANACAQGGGDALVM